MMEGIRNITSTLQSVAQKLQAITNKWKLITIVTNQMTTRIKGNYSACRMLHL